MAERERAPRLPPRWFIRTFWFVHRAVCRVSRGRLGLWPPKENGWGTLRLTTTGRRTGEQRRVVVAYLEDGADLFTLAMNGWADPEPSWWLNLRARPEAQVELRRGPGPVPVVASAAEGEERARLWARWREIDPQLDAHAARRSSQTAVVVLSPLPRSPVDPMT